MAMTFDEFMAKVLQTFPTATVGEDSTGQLIIYTNLVDVEDQIVPINDEEEE